MSYSFIVIAVLFGISTAGIPIYSFVTKRHFIQQKVYFIVQGLFWIAISIISIYNLFSDLPTFTLIINAALALIGLAFGAYAISAIKKDKGSYVLPYAKNDNKESFEKYLTNLDVEKIDVNMTVANRYDVIRFTSCTQEQITTIMRYIKGNSDMVILWRSWEAWKRLISSFTFGIFVIIIALLL